MIGLGTLLLLSLIGAGVSAGAGIASSAMQKKAQEEANATNVELQKMANEANLEQTRLANEAQLQQVQMTNEFNAAEAQKQRDWETQMSNTAIQRSMADYSAAGINPLMALPGGASTPSGATAQGNVANIKAAHADAARVSPASLDITAIGSAVQAMTNFMLTSAFLQNSQNKTVIAMQNAETKLGQSLHMNQLNDAKTGFYRKITSAVGNSYYRRYR